MNKIQNTKNKNQKGITLIALIITIIILLILAVVAISAVTGNGIINHAKNARTEYGKAQDAEQSALDNYISKIEENLPGGGNSGDGKENGGDGEGKTEEPDEEDNVTEEWETSTTVKTAKASGKPYKNNTAITDEYGNTVTVLAGFKIASDSADDVTGGVVIEDATVDGEGNPTATTGSQFVWIPVGEVKYEEDGESKTATITLGRGGIQTAEQSNEFIGIKNGAGAAITGFTYYEYLGSSTGGSCTTRLGSFIESTTQNGGYYLGRYEARTATERTSKDEALTQITCKSSDYIYNYISHSQALSQSQGMYTSSNYTSDLINSYAWDTALGFIKTFDANYVSSESPNTGFVTSGGTSLDKLCNIYDMRGN